MSRTKRRGLQVLLAATVAAAGIAYALGQGSRREDPVLRPGFALPDPSPREELAFLYDLFRSGRQVELGGQPVPVWRHVGETALIRRGADALDLLLDPARTEEYRRAPDIVANVLRILPQMPGAGEHDQLYPFLLRWLDPDTPPRGTEKEQLVANFRVLAFAAMKRFPRPPALDPCVEEFRREERVHDLRTAAVQILFMLGRTDVLEELYDLLPPNEREPAGNVRGELMAYAHRTLAPGRSEADLEKVRALLPRIERAARSPDTGERQNAIAALMRLGRAGMEERLIAEYERGLELGIDRDAWNALDLLAKDAPHPFVRDAAWKRFQEPDDSLGFSVAARLLARWWLDDPEIAEALWRETESGEHLYPLTLLRRLMRQDRARGLRYLEGELRSGDARRVEEALRFVGGENLTELGGVLAQVVRETAPLQRPPLYKTLEDLETPGTEALLMAELDSPHRVVRDAAITELLDLGGSRGLARLDELLDGPEPTLLAALLRRARLAGRAGVPEELVPGILRALRRGAGEDTRRTALFILRYRGTLDGVEAGLREAYRREPSSRVADEIREVALELAHRS